MMRLRLALAHLLARAAVRLMDASLRLDPPPEVPPDVLARIKARIPTHNGIPVVDATLPVRWADYV